MPDVRQYEMSTKTRLFTGVCLLVCGIGLAVFAHVALKQFAMCCHVSPPPTEAQVQQDFPVFSLACNLMGYDFFAVVERHYPGLLIMTTIRRFYPWQIVGAIFGVVGVAILLASFLPARHSRLVRWAATIVIALLLVQGLCICLRGPGGKIVPFKETANNVLENIGTSAPDPQD